MFKDTQIPPIAYKAPWTSGFHERIAALTARPRRVAYYYEHPDTSTFRYRVFNMVEALAAAPQCETSAAWFHSGDLDRMDQFVDRADALVLCRTRYAPAIGYMVMRARARRIPVLFDVDDLVFNPDYVHLVLNTLDQEISHEALETWFAAFARLGVLLRLCDRAITTNPFLAQQIEAFAPDVRARVLPNFLNRQQQALSSRLFERKRKSGFMSDRNIHIGYFSGTPTHNRDFAVSAHALARVLDDDPRVILRVVGFLDLKDALAQHRERIEIHQLQDFLNLQRLIAETEINIVPLQQNLFTNCKSELKYFEAAITGSITIASPTYTFRRAVVDGKNSFLASSHEWEVKLHGALDMVRERGRYADMANRGFCHAEQAYGWNMHGKAIEQTIFESETTLMRADAEVGLRHESSLPAS
jgi:glycosyltransferase involved in cell wall biosynthesis